MKRWTMLWLCFAVAATVPLTALAETDEASLEYQQAREGCELGEVRDCRNLARIYLQGRGEVGRDIQKAAEIFPPYLRG